MYFSDRFFLKLHFSFNLLKIITKNHSSIHIRPFNKRNRFPERYLQKDIDQITMKMDPVLYALR